MRIAFEENGLSRVRGIRGAQARGCAVPRYRPSVEASPFVIRASEPPFLVRSLRFWMDALRVWRAQCSKAAQSRGPAVAGVCSSAGARYRGSGRVRARGLESAVMEAA